MKKLQSSDFGILKFHWDSPVLPVTCSPIQMVGPEFWGSETRRFSPAPLWEALHEHQHWGGGGCCPELGKVELPGGFPQEPPAEAKATPDGR